VRRVCVPCVRVCACACVYYQGCVSVCILTIGGHPNTNLTKCSSNVFLCVCRLGPSQHTLRVRLGIGAGDPCCRQGIGLIYQRHQRALAAWGVHSHHHRQAAERRAWRTRLPTRAVGRECHAQQQYLDGVRVQTQARLQCEHRPRTQLHTKGRARPAQPWN
jgi:hypothetical protein